MGIFAIYIHFLHHLERHSIIQLAKATDFGITSWILMTKLIAWKTDNHQTSILIFLVKSFQSLKLWCESTLAGCINDKNNLTFYNSLTNIVNNDKNSKDLLTMHRQR